MKYLKQFNFNRTSGWVSVVLASIATGVFIFAGVYLAEGISWLTADNPRELDVYYEVGWNWVNGSGLALVIALALGAAAYVLLRRNRKLPRRNKPLWGRLNLNESKGLIGLVFLSTSLVFFFNAALYRIEVNKWIYASVELSRAWYLDIAASWASAAATMNVLGAILAAGGFILLILASNK